MAFSKGRSLNADALAVEARNSSFSGLVTILSFAFVMTFFSDGFDESTTALADDLFELSLALAVLATIAWNASRVASVALVIFMLSQLFALLLNPENLTRAPGTLAMSCIALGLIWAGFLIKTQFDYFAAIKRLGRQPHGNRIIRNSAGIIALILFATLSIDWTVDQVSRERTPGRLGPRLSHLQVLSNEDAIKRIDLWRRQGLLPQSPPIDLFYIRQGYTGSQSGLLVTGGELVVLEVGINSTNNADLISFERKDKETRIKLGEICDFGQFGAVNIPFQTLHSETFQTLRTVDDRTVTIQTVTYDPRAANFLSSLKAMNARRMTNETRAACNLDGSPR